MRQAIKDSVKIGAIFGRLKVISISSRKDKRGAAFFKCLCVCGKKKEINAQSLKRGVTKSCGCYQKERTAEAKRRSPGNVSWQELYVKYRREANYKDLTFQLSLEQYKKISSNNCQYCNAPPRNYSTYFDIKGEMRENRIVLQETANRSWINANGIDRIDSNEGYTLQNCVPCCKNCNFMKNDLSLSKFFEQIKNIYNFQKRKGTI